MVLGGSGLYLKPTDKDWVNVRVEEEYADVLQNIEAAIITVFDGNPSVVDRDVLAAIDALIGAYQREKRNRIGVARCPPGRARAVYEQCHHVCEWRLGRQLLNEGETVGIDFQSEELAVPELISCLKRIRKSIRLWHKQGGRQGYLKYIRQFFDDADSRIGI